MTDSTPAPELAAAATRSGWGHPVRFFQPHNPACYLYWALILKGAFLYYAMVASFSAYSTALFIGIVSQVLYCLPWIWFLTHKDRFEREPARLAFLGFLWGGLVATWVISQPGNGANLSLMVKLIGLEFHDRWGPAISAPIVEESAKYVGVVMLALLARDHVRSAYDGFLLGAFVGLGFQVFENLLYVLTAAGSNYGSQQVADALRILTVRTLTGFWSHALYSAITATGLGYFLGAKDRSLAHRLTVAAGFILIACLAHGLWDAAIGWPLFLPVALCLGTGGILFAWWFSERRQRDFVAVLLADEVARGTLSQAELDAISGRPGDRRHFLKEIQASSSSEDAKRASLVLDAAIDLAAAIAATEAPDGPAAEAARSEIARVRSPQNDQTNSGE